MKYVFATILIAMVTGCTTSSPEKTATQYCNALLEHDFELFKSLYPESRRPTLNEDSFKRMKLSSCSVESVAPPYATIRYRVAWDQEIPEMPGTLYILPNGKIKYDPIFSGHPALALRGLLLQMESEELLQRKSAFMTLTKWKLPLFGFDPEAPAAERSASTEKFREWVENNEATFDLGKPVIPLSPIDRERLEKQ